MDTIRRGEVMDTVTISCSRGYRQSGNTCVPDDSEVIRKTRDIRCPDGRQPLPDGTCSEISILCNPGYRQSGRTCVPNPGDSRCQFGTKPEGGCIPKQCMIGQTLSEDGTCERSKIDCKFGDMVSADGTRCETQYNIQDIMSKIDQLINRLEHSKGGAEQTNTELSREVRDRKVTLGGLQSQVADIQSRITDANNAVTSDTQILTTKRGDLSSARDRLNVAQATFNNNTKLGSSLAGSSKTLTTQLADLTKLLSKDESDIIGDTKYNNTISGSVSRARLQLGSSLTAQTMATKSKDSAAILRTTKAVSDLNAQITQLTRQLTAGSSKLASDTARKGSHAFTATQIQNALKDIKTNIDSITNTINKDLQDLNIKKDALTTAQNAVDIAQNQVTIDTQRQDYLVNQRGSISQQILQGSSIIATKEGEIASSGSRIKTYTEQLEIARGKLAKAQVAQTSRTIGVFGDITRWLDGSY